MRVLQGHGGRPNSTTPSARSPGPRRPLAQPEFRYRKLVGGRPVRPPNNLARLDPASKLDLRGHQQDIVEMLLDRMCLYGGWKEGLGLGHGSLFQATISALERISWMFTRVDGTSVRMHPLAYSNREQSCTLGHNEFRKKTTKAT